MSSRTALLAVAALSILGCRGNANNAFPLVLVTVRVSLDSAQRESNSYSSRPSLSKDGRYVAFESLATNLTSGNTNGVSQIYLRDTLLGTTTIVSVRPDGTPGPDHSTNPSISWDGQYVAFETEDQSLVAGGPPHPSTTDNVVVRDMTLGITTWVSVDSNETQPGQGINLDPSISGDGKFIAFASTLDLDTQIVVGGVSFQIYLRDREAGTTSLVSLGPNGATGDGDSRYPSVSFDGTRIAFASQAGNFGLTDTNGGNDVFLRDTNGPNTTLLSHTSSSSTTTGNGASTFPSISGNGQFVAFESAASNLLSAVDFDAKLDVYVRDIDNSITTLVSVTSAGTQVFDADAASPSISADGRYVAFDSGSPSLVNFDDNGASSDVFLHDRQSKTTILISVASGGAPQGNNISYDPRISPDGRFVAFESDATNLAEGDTNHVPDVFLRGPG